MVADQKTWLKSFTRNIFGFKENTKGLWNTTNVGDFVSFYATSPIKKIIGFGKITKKFLDEELFFPDEILFKRPLWKYRVQFEVLRMIDDWNSGISPPKTIMLNVGRREINKDIFSEITKSL